MTDGTSRRGPRATRLLILATAVVVTYVAVTAVQVWAAASADGTRSAQAIIVLGAAQYDGRPSPALRERLDHAAELYRAGVAPVLVVTGGGRPGDRFSEATASVTYLHALGIPDGAIRREVQGRNTWEQLAASSRFLRDEGIVDVVLVSHPWHAYRLALIAEEVALDATVSSTRTGSITRGGNWRHAVRETAAVSIGRLTGFRRLTNLMSG